MARSSDRLPGREGGPRPAFYDTCGFGGRNYMQARRGQRMNIAVTVLHCLLGAYLLMWVVLIWFL